jgi:hypothetical protein
VVNTFVVHRKGGPGRTPAVGRVAGSFGSGLISRIWQPSSISGIAHGFASGGISVGADVGMNVAREFWPRREKAEKERQQTQP